MARCFYCCHCGKCGPGSAGGGKLNPRGYCIFCGTQNDGDAETCSNCGKVLPPVAGGSMATAKEDAERTMA